MTLTFEPLHESHFPLLLRWLESPHVKKWWDQDVTHTIDSVYEKYSSYSKGYKRVEGVQKPIQAFIIHNKQNPVGYIQIYNAHDFPRSKPLLGLPENLGAFDIFIGEAAALQRGLGSQAIFEFLNIHGGQYSHIFANPDSNNVAAVKCYAKAGFKQVSAPKDTGEVWMLKDLPPLNDSPQSIKKNLAYAYRILSYLKLDDHTYTHLSARSERGFYIYPFGLLFSEVNPENLLEVTLDGEVLLGSEYQYNKTGYIIHGEIYKKRPDINVIFHIHTPEIVAVSAHQNGMMPVSQWALHFYDRIAYHNYNSLALNGAQGQKLTDDLQDYFVMLMRNHGSITCGRTIQEALFYTYHLQQACKTQCMIQDISNVIMPSPEISKNTVSDLLSFEENLGERDWQAWLRLIDAPAESKTLADSNKLSDFELHEIKTIYQFESDLLQSQTRQNIDKLNKLIDDTFYEIGASGKTYNKQAVIESLPLEANPHNYGKITNFEATYMTKNLIRVNYTLEEKNRHTQRTSIWKKDKANNYSLVFHQGTVIDESGA